MKHCCISTVFLHRLSIQIRIKLFFFSLSLLLVCLFLTYLVWQGMTMIKFLTDGVLIREMMEDPLLTKYRYQFISPSTST